MQFTLLCVPTNIIYYKEQKIMTTKVYNKVTVFFFTVLNQKIYYKCIVTTLFKVSFRVRFRVST